MTNDAEGLPRNRELEVLRREAPLEGDSKRVPLRTMQAPTYRSKAEKRCSLPTPVTAVAGSAERRAAKPVIAPEVEQLLMSNAFSTARSSRERRRRRRTTGDTSGFETLGGQQRVGDVAVPEKNSFQDELRREAEVAALKAELEATKAQLLEASRSGGVDLPEISLEETEQALRQAVAALCVEPTAALEAEVERLSAAVEQHPERKRRIAEERAAWIAREVSGPAKAALEEARALVPSDVARLSEAQLEARLGSASLAKRFFKHRVLRLVWAEPESLAKLHPSDLEGKYVAHGLDIVESRAVWMVARQAPFELADADGRKRKWFEELERRVKELADREQRGDLTNKERRHDAYRSGDTPASSSPAQEFRSASAPSILDPKADRHPPNLLADIVHKRDSRRSATRQPGPRRHKPRPPDHSTLLSDLQKPRPRLLHRRSCYDGQDARTDSMPSTLQDQHDTAHSLKSNILSVPTESHTRARQEPHRPSLSANISRVRAASHKHRTGKLGQAEHEPSDLASCPITSSTFEDDQGKQRKLTPPLGQPADDGLRRIAAHQPRPNRAGRSSQGAMPTNVGQPSLDARCDSLRISNLCAKFEQPTNTNDNTSTSQGVAGRRRHSEQRQAPLVAQAQATTIKRAPRHSDSWWINKIREGATERAIDRVANAAHTLRTVKERASLGQRTENLSVFLRQQDLTKWEKPLTSARFVTTDDLKEISVAVVDGIARDNQLNKIDVLRLKLALSRLRDDPVS